MVLNMECIVQSLLDRGCPRRRGHRHSPRDKNNKPDPKGFPRLLLRPWLPTSENLPREERSHRGQLQKRNLRGGFASRRGFLRDHLLLLSSVLRIPECPFVPCPVHQRLIGHLFSDCPRPLLVSQLEPALGLLVTNAPAPVTFSAEFVGF